MAEGGDVREDIRLPEGDLGKEIQERFEKDEQLLVTVLTAMDEEAAIAVKSMPK